MTRRGNGKDSAHLARTHTPRRRGGRACRRPANFPRFSRCSCNCKPAMLGDRTGGWPAEGVGGRGEVLVLAVCVLQYCTRRPRPRSLFLFYSARQVQLGIRARHEFILWFHLVCFFFFLLFLIINVFLLILSWNTRFGQLHEFTMDFT